VLKLHSQSVPGQIPFGSLLPQELDNLAVINCLSSTHLGFSAVRVEPTWMAVGEAVGCAAFLAKQDGVLFANLDRRKLVFELARQRLPISYFEDLDCGSSEPWLTAVQGLSAFGFFPGYYSYPTSPLTDITLRLWIRAAHDLRKSYSVESADDIARRLSEQLVREAPSELNSQPLTNSAIALITQEELLPTDFSHIISTESKVVHRGRFCHLLMKYILSKDFS